MGRRHFLRGEICLARHRPTNAPTIAHATAIAIRQGYAERAGAGACPLDSNTVATAYDVMRQTRDGTRNTGTGDDLMSFSATLPRYQRDTPVLP